MGLPKAQARSHKEPLAGEMDLMKKVLVLKRPPDQKGVPK